MGRQEVPLGRKALAGLHEISHTLFKAWSQRGSNPRPLGVKSADATTLAPVQSLTGDVAIFSEGTTSPVPFIF